MRDYLLAVACPPAALWRVRGVGHAALGLALCLLGLASIRWGLGILVLFGCILWAVRAVGDSRAAEVSARFIRSVPPLRPGRW